MLDDVTKVRLDRLLVERGLVESRERGRRLIMAGEVKVGDRVTDKPGTLIAPDVEIHIKQHLPYVSRGGLKLAAALDEFDVPVEAAVCADVGASTGGFTDVLLQRGASRVIAIDVGYGQLAWKLRSDARVTVLDRTNARLLTELPVDPETNAATVVSVTTIDASFISLRLLLPSVARWLIAGGHVVALIKPQFEAGRKQVGKGGIVKDPQVHRGVLQSLLTWAIAEHWIVRGLTRSPVKGAAGNIEFLCWLIRSNAGTQSVDVEAAIQRVLTIHP